METGPRLKVSSNRLVKPGIEPETPGLQGKRFIHYTTAAPSKYVVMFRMTDWYSPVVGFISRNLFPILLFHDFHHLFKIYLLMAGFKLENKNLN